ncbi:Neprilysin 2-like protein [Sarcoptes scabiei]|uniref:Neprilysin 2-like protein n=1 Tax=Sarcoptes scabiei TaxID=52283 RepID=A0A132A7M1_SARSC|nr:Neprilysin 2-like protein [Sarcoptes scabiei]
MNDIDLEPKLIDEMREILNFEKMLANNSITKEERSNITRLYNEMTIEQLERISPNVEWLQLINIFTESIQLTLTNESKIVVTDLNYVKFLSDIMPSTSKRLITNYIVWRVIKSKIGILDSTWRRLKQTYNSVNMGHPRIESRWLQCVSHTYASLGTALSNIYIKNHFTLKGKNKIDEIVDKIRAELNTTINYATWMDSRTKQSALDKLASMNFRIGYPDELLDDDLISKYYENLTLTENYFENVIALHKFFVESSFKSLKEINYRNDWRKYTDVIDVNAYYYHQENSFILNAGILQDRFFNPDRPNYLNYGSIGEIIGHEITHGFDSIGKQYDKTGRLRNWWDPKTDELYQKKASCMVDQYNQYSFEQIAMNLNGDNTKDENIADNIGVALAYRAYVRAYHSFWSETEQYLPGLSYNPRQLFWISYGLENCEKMTDEMLKITLQLDTHSPGKYRLNGVVSNSRSFASDFGCPTASPMNPETKCQVW